MDSRKQIKSFSSFINGMELLGKYYIYLLAILRLFFRPPFRIKRVLYEMEKIGANSFPIIALASVAIGIIFSIQLEFLLRLFRVEILIGAAVGLTMSRELAPIVTAIMLIARDGSAMAAEIGTMKVTDQLDAMETMTVDSVHFLALPKVAAALLSFPLLTAASNMMGLAGAYIIGVWVLGVDHSGFSYQLSNFMVPADIISGLIKSVFFGFFISTICCFYGFQTKRGAKAVGESTTKAVVASMLVIFLLDFILTVIMLNVFYPDIQV